MRRLLRSLVNGLVNALCLLSLLACVGTAWVWWRSYREWVGVINFYESRFGEDDLNVLRGTVSYFHMPPGGIWSGSSVPRHHVLCVGYDFFGGFVILEAPCWFLLAGFCIPPAAWAATRVRRARARRRRRRLGLCVRCGYDLRGNTSGKCSECGAEVEAMRAKGTVTA